MRQLLFCSFAVSVKYFWQFLSLMSPVMVVFQFWLIFLWLCTFQWENLKECFSVECFVETQSLLYDKSDNYV